MAHFSDSFISREGGSGQGKHRVHDNSQHMEANHNNNNHSSTSISEPHHHHQSIKPNPVKALTVDLLKTYESIEGPSSISQSYKSNKKQQSTAFVSPPKSHQTCNIHNNFQSSKPVEQSDESYNLGLVSSAMGVPLNPSMVSQRVENTFPVFYPSALHGMPITQSFAENYGTSHCTT